MLSVRIAWAAVVLAGVAASFAWGLVGGSEPSAAPEAQRDALCRQAAIASEQVAREYEKETGERANRFSAEECAHGADPGPLAP